MCYLAPRRGRRALQPFFLLMALFSIIAALLLEQLRAADTTRLLIAPLRAWCGFLEARFNDGTARNGAIAWGLALGVPVAVTGAIYAALFAAHPLLAVLLNVAVLYITTGFRQFSHRFTDIQLALRMGELDRARSLLADWRCRAADRASSVEVARLAIEEGILHSHRYVFAVMLWFFLLPGPLGALAYRIADFLDREWGRHRIPEASEFGSFSRRAFEWIDWLPARLTATGFAVVGDFEDALFCWRTQAARWPEAGSGILLASGAGALGVRLGLPVYESGEVTERPELGLGEDPDADFMQSAIGLVWRTLALSVLLIALVTIAGWVGR